MDLWFVPIQSFACTDTQALFHGRLVWCFKNLEQAARRKLLTLHALIELDNLRIPPANRPKALQENRKGQPSIRINNQWRLCFIWQNSGAYSV
ncbi:MAG: type II toxin-antitoxin system RelE/ParE family toxin [Chitinophagaceae bacterium]|nr:type II toxin-antitoxin system RelE/ParE family toxin [Polaromonas sp.]